VTELDTDQEQAAHTDKKRVAISAAPGSGKTRTIVARYEYMTQELHINPNLIAVCTFTRRASQEFKGRIGRSGSQSYMGTFHSFALTMLKMYGHTIGYESGWLSILDELEVEDEEKAILKDMGLISSRGQWARGCTATLWSKFKKQIMAGELEDTLYGLEKELGMVWQTLNDRLRAENAVTFDTLILEALRLFEDPGTAEKLRGCWQHVLCDEMQDASRKEWDLVKALNPETLAVVYDVNQSIYGWREAKPELCTQFANDPETTHYQLHKSYRFGINIAAPANALISRNTKSVDDAITAISQNEGTVNVIQDAQYSDIADTIKKELDSGRKPEDIAVLARKHDTLIKLATVLGVENIPFTRLQGGRNAVNKSGAFRTVKGYLRLVCNPDDRRAFMAIATAEGISTLDLLNLRQDAMIRDISLAEAYGKELPESVDTIREHLSGSIVDYDPSFRWINGIVKFEAISEVTELVEYLSMESMADQMREVGESVTILTGHASKGCEWPVVFVVGLTAKNFPSPRSIKEGRGSEERRLMYVCMTRAEESLYLVQNAPEETGDGPSSFMSEVGELPILEKEIDKDDLIY